MAPAPPSLTAFFSTMSLTHPPAVTPSLPALLHSLATVVCDLTRVRIRLLLSCFWAVIFVEPSMMDVYTCG
jgi:hypothetical protein